MQKQIAWGEATSHWCQATVWSLTLRLAAASDAASLDSAMPSHWRYVQSSFQLLQVHLYKGSAKIFPDTGGHLDHLISSA